MGAPAPFSPADEDPPAHDLRCDHRRERPFRASVRRLRHRRGSRRHHAGAAAGRPGPERGADGGGRARAHAREPGDLRGRDHRARLLSPRRGAAALLRRHLEPLGRLVPPARRLGLHPAPLGRASAAGRSPSPTSTPTRPRPTPSSTCRSPPAGTTSPIAEAGKADFRHVLFRFSHPPTRFAEKFRAEIEASDRISLVLNANLVDLRLSDDLGGVSEAVFSSYPPEPRRFSVRAQVYCLCAGGLENPRLLLNFTGQEPKGVGNRNDLVGRFFCEHPHFVLADLLLEEPHEHKEFYAPTEAFMDAATGAELRPAPRAGQGAAAHLPQAGGASGAWPASATSPRSWRRRCSAARPRLRQGRARGLLRAAASPRTR